MKMTNNTGRYRYQAVGTKFLIDNKRAILGDSPGLGKSCQALDAVVALKCKRTLVICLNSLKNNWEKEINTWYPEATVTIVKSDSTVEQRDAWIATPANFTIISFNQIITVTRYDKFEMPDGSIKKIPKEVLAKNVPMLLSQHWDAIVIDEAHTLRGRSSKATQTVKKLARRVSYLFHLTGTAIWSDPTNLFPLLQTIDNKKFSSFHRWAEEWFNTKKNYFSGFNDYTTVKEPKAFKDHLKPYMLVRKQEDVQPDLPATTIIHVPVELLPKQRKQYDQMRKKMVLELGDKVIYSLNEVSKISRLRKICLSSDLFFEEGEFDAGQADAGGFEGAKLEVLLDHLDSFPKDDKVVIYSPFASPIWRLLPILQKKYKVAAFTGKTPNGSKDSPLDNSTRWGIIRQLQERDLHIMMITSAGSVGGTYTAANRFIFLNADYVPAANEQAYKRIARIGQTKPVFVYNFYAVNTIEEKILNINNDKDALFNSITPVSAVDAAMREYFQVSKE
jgi:SNF2 family DNA or RNA helicase